MWLRFSPIDIPTDAFLTPNGVAKSVELVQANREKVAWVTGSLVWLDSSHIHFLLGELIDLTQGSWHHASIADIERLRSQREKLNNNTFQDYLETITLIQDIVKRVWEAYFSDIVALEGRETITDDRKGVSYRLGQCALFAIRVGIESATVERWKSKLIESHSSILERNIYTTPDQK